MSDFLLVYEPEIASLFYLKSDRKIANYLGIEEGRVTNVREKMGKSYDEPRPRLAPEAPAMPLPAPLEAEMVKAPLTPEAVFTPTLCPTCGAPVSGRLTIMHIQALVAAYYKMPFREMISARRGRAVAHPRQVAMYLAYELTPKSFVDIGQRFGGRDHTTVIHAVKAVQERMLKDPEIEADVCALRERLAA